MTDLAAVRAALKGARGLALDHEEADLDAELGRAIDIIDAISDADTLDAAWSAAEAALPEGAHLWLVHDPEDGYEAEAERVHQRQEAGVWVGGFFVRGVGPTPVAALLALAAALADVP